MNATQALALVDDDGWFESFEVGQKWRHARGATVDVVENQTLTKLVMNTAQEHWNEDSMKGSEWGASRIVFGLITGSLTIGLTSQDTAEHAIRELGLDDIRFTSSVFHGDSIYAYTEVLKTTDSDQDDAGVVTFQHWGATAEGRMVFRCVRTVLIKRRSHWSHV
jgi:itaconyl-CoA hydratase